MKRGLNFKMFVYFLSVSFLLLMNEFPKMMLRRTKIFLLTDGPRGGVKFEVKENAWEKVETPFRCLKDED